MTTGQLPLFEGISPNHTRVVLSGSLDSENYPSIERALELGSEVTFMCKAKVTQVVHAEQGKEGDKVERRHVLVINHVRFDEGGLKAVSGDDADWENG
jgi:hypothetical protein